MIAAKIHNDGENTNLPDEVIKTGTLFYYNDSDDGLIEAANKYNEKMSACRMRMKLIEEVEFSLLVLNPLVTFSLALTRAETVFQNIGPAVFILLVYFALFTVFTLIKKNCLISALSTVLLVALDMRFAILFAANAAIYLIYRIILRPLKKSEGYPNFTDICIPISRKTTAEIYRKIIVLSKTACQAGRPSNVLPRAYQLRIFRQNMNCFFSRFMLIYKV